MSVAARAFVTPGDQRRRGLLAKVHIAKKQLGLSDDDYRAIIFTHCSATPIEQASDEDLALASARNATDDQLERIVQHFAQRGFKTVAKVPGRKAPAADFPAAKKARALWISLYQLGAVRNRSDAALEAFAKRQMQVENWRWSDQSMSYRLIEALKAMAKRHGWDVGEGSHAKLIGSKYRLNRAILKKLVDAGVAHPDWRVPEALFRLTGEEVREIDLTLSIELQTRVSQLLGDVLRDRAPMHNPEA
ncbi:regulatory protein GemA [Sphingopyxis sp. YF1]|uniref:regulatory protein GemA n=1 Tax=Sphingopyxis sp. YF1 TaxID=2482763 RepID=UPI001F60C3F0|nr:regulatory protein GemA [Sphingopyxis sp. YF1]